ncbi:NADP-dependent oxidoreductase [Gordonia neofelifaecis]|nr:NADP-dependent oxidoreductase [Gordonia neofelifaecis]
MKAALIHRTGSPEEFQVSDVEVPTPGDGEILVRVAASAVNPVDVKTRSGFLPFEIAFPATLGWDVAGIVTAVGEGVDRFSVGDAVIGMVCQPMRGAGTYAEQVVADQSLFAGAPAGVDLVDAAAIPLGGLTARQLVDDLALDADDTVAVIGARGAVGRIVVQLLVAAGISTVAVARDADREDLLALGATEVVTSTDELPGASFDAVVDTAGIGDAARDLVVDGGKLTMIYDGEYPAPARGVEPKRWFVQENGDQLQELSDGVAAGTLTVPVSWRFPLTEVAEAHTVFEAGGIRGKIVLVP